LDKFEQITSGRKFKNLVLLIVVLAVDVTAVRELHCAAAVGLQWCRLCMQRALKPATHILNKVFDFNNVDYSSSYEPTGLSFFVIFVHLAVVK